jgi:prolyl oligopeptidase
MRLVLPAAAFLLIAAAPPPAPVETVTEPIHGITVTDSYRWMESGKDPRWMPHLKAQADFTRATLDALPGRAALFRDIQARTGAFPAVAVPKMAGGNMVWQERPVGAEDIRLMIRRGQVAPVVLWETDGKTTGAEVIDRFSLSPDGKWVAIESSARGSERSGISLIEAATGRRLPLRLADSQSVQWLADSTGFTFIRYIGEHGTPTYMVANETRLHRLGQGDGDSLLIKARGAPGVDARPEQVVIVAPARNSANVMLIVRDGRSEFAAFRSGLADVMADQPKWTRAFDFSDTIVDASIAANDLYVTSRKEDSNGRVLLLDAAAPNLGQAVALSVPGNPVIEQIAAAKSGVWVIAIEGGEHALWFVPKSGAPRRIPTPFAGSMGGLENDPEKDDALIGASGWFQPFKIFHLAQDGEVHDIGMVPALPYDTSAYVATSGMARSHDGAMIPYTVLTSRKVPARGPRPTLLEAYGSYGYSLLPGFNSRVPVFLDRGGAYVLANVRGGGEFGRKWHYAGKAGTKANTWLDAIAVAQKIQADGLASPATTTILGTSAGGVMIGGAVNARPDLFSGAIANVGFMNPTRYVAEQNYGDIEEWGGPIKDAATYGVMAALDPTLNIRKGVRYPATLVVSGLNDPRAATFHSAKYAASLAAATSSGEPVLLRIDFDAGHGAGFGSSRTQADGQWADMLSFALWQGAAPAFQPRP